MKKSRYIPTVQEILNPPNEYSPEANQRIIAKLKTLHLCDNILHGCEYRSDEGSPICHKPSEPCDYHKEF